MHTFKRMYYIIIIIIIIIISSLNNNLLQLKETLQGIALWESGVELTAKQSTVSA